MAEQQLTPKDIRTLHEAVDRRRQRLLDAKFVDQMSALPIRLRLIIDKMRSANQ